MEYSYDSIDLSPTIFEGKEKYTNTNFLVTFTTSHTFDSITDFTFRFTYINTVHYGTSYTYIP